ncbi:DNA topoisomerase 2-binding protein 1-A isoform X3 [Microplitis mediator]|uniref:DNA topoisomerase 2-binding protein 1-A isoform X3 n=1 Tax=Microplitis mediator TaxID=375433 RepID=UPI002555606B|nr:DNA topoisomerase 2-binding protein 1-A isoform X3 [Microplitis mediator]
MTSQYSQLDSLNIYFVIFSKHKSEQNCSDDMWDAFNKCQDNDLLPRWITEDECKIMKPTKTDIFVLENFSGDILKHLQQFSRIVGPPCLLRCFLTCEPIPEGTSPIYTTSMQGLGITASGFPADIKKDIQMYVEYMGGVYYKDLRGCVTHLVAQSATSTKFEIACSTNIPVYTYDWIKKVWQENLKTFISATDSRFDRYKCPVFLNIVVTASNIGKRDKETIKQLIMSNGGEFMGPLDGTKVTAVITNEYSTNSDKIKYAMTHNLPCIKRDWVVKSVEAGYALPFNDYLITPKGTLKCSTPESGSTQAAQASFDCSGMSVIPHSTRNFIDDTIQSMMSTMSETAEPNVPSYVGILESLDIKEAKKAGPFLDGCNIYLAGFATHHRDKVIKILNAGSATRFDDLSDALSHVIVGDKSKAAQELKLIKSKGLNLHIVTVSWLQESIKFKKPASEDAHRVDKQITTTKTTEPASPLSKKSIQMLQKPRRPPVPQFSFDKPENDEPDIVQQYLNKTNDKITSEVPSFSNERSNSDPKVSNLSRSKISSEKKSNSESNTSITRTSQRYINQTGESNQPTQSTVPDQIFDDLKFLLIGLDDEEYLQMSSTIEAVGGKIVTNSFKGIPDYAVVPVTGAALKHTVGEIVTPLFIEECIEMEKVVDIMYYHRALSIPDSAKPLSECVVATSSYSSSERYYLQQLAIALGANYQDTFARKTNIEKDQYAATHLICLEPSGNKYNAAVKWKLPAVTADWLRACGERLTLVDETPYLVGETMAPERSNNQKSTSQSSANQINESMGPPSTPAVRQVLTPKRRLTQTPGVETPLINKRLNLSGHQNTPQSPFHVNTPETPYGQIFRTNPSPNLRKACAKWIDSLPDKVEAPQPRQRAPSTPLSELKKQMWSAMKKPGGDKNQQPLDQSTPDQASVDSPHQATDLSHQRINSSHQSINEDHTHMSYEEENNAEPDEPVPRQLFANELENENNPINEQLEHMNKLLNSARTSSAESRFSLNGDNKIYDDPKERNNYLVPDTQPESVGWEDPNPPRMSSKLLGNSLQTPESSLEPSRLEISIRETPKRKFMLSGLKDRPSYEEAIRQLGGEISTDANFDPTATHLLCIRPSRNEKMLGSIASGKWVLHCSYIRACENAGEFVDEEDYEWGNSRCDKMKELTTAQEIELAKAAYRWRIKLSNKNSGAFENMVAILIVPKEKYPQFERLINAGGGIVVQAKHPYDSPKGKKITHCFIQINKVTQTIDWAMLASKGILCFLPPYLNSFLTSTDALNPREHVIAEFKKYLTLFPK